jgi:hypothetical protein
MRTEGILNFDRSVIEGQSAWRVPRSLVRSDCAASQPQPYEQLAEFYRRAVHDDDVRRVLLAKQRHRRTTLSAPGRPAGRPLDTFINTLDLLVPILLLDLR